MGVSKNKRRVPSALSMTGVNIKGTRVRTIIIFFSITRVSSRLKCLYQKIDVRKATVGRWGHIRHQVSDLEISLESRTHLIAHPFWTILLFFFPIKGSKRKWGRWIVWLSRKYLSWSSKGLFFLSNPTHFPQNKFISRDNHINWLVQRLHEIKITLVMKKVETIDKKIR